MFSEICWSVIVFMGVSIENSLRWGKRKGRFLRTAQVNRPRLVVWLDLRQHFFEFIQVDPLSPRLLDDRVILAESDTERFK